MRVRGRVRGRGKGRGKGRGGAMGSGRGSGRGRGRGRVRVRAQQARRVRALLTDPSMPSEARLRSYGSRPISSKTCARHMYICTTGPVYA